MEITSYTFFFLKQNKNIMLCIMVCSYYQCSSLAMSNVTAKRKARNQYSMFTISNVSINVLIGYNCSANDPGNTAKRQKTEKEKTEGRKKQSTANNQSLNSLVHRQQSLTCLDTRAEQFRKRIGIFFKASQCLVSGGSCSKRMIESSSIGIHFE